MKTPNPNKYWTPVRSGKYYCSPGCVKIKDARCTWKAYQHAVRESKRIQKELDPGWKSFIFENHGWHWRLVNQHENFRVMIEPGGRGYHAVLDVPSFKDSIRAESAYLPIALIKMYRRFHAQGAHNEVILEVDKYLTSTLLKSIVKEI